MDRNLFPVRGVEHDMVPISGRAPITAAPAVGTHVGRGFTLARTGAGLYRLTFSDAVVAINAIQPCLYQAAGSAKLLIVADVIDTANHRVDLRTYSAPWAGSAVEGAPYAILGPIAGGAGTDVMPAYGGVHDSKAPGLAGVVHPDYPRNLEVATAGAGAFTLTGTSISGTTVTETKAAAGAETVVFTIAVARIIRLQGAAGGTWRLAAAARTVLGRPANALTISAYAENGVAAALPAVTVNKTFDPVTNPAPGVDYALWYRWTESAVPALADPSTGDEIGFVAWVRSSTVSP